MDHTTAIYYLVIFIGCIGFGLLVFDIIRRRPDELGEVFISAMLLTAGVVVIATVNVIGRKLRQDSGIYISEEWFWPYRWYPVVLGIAYLDYYLIKKLLGYTDKA